MAGENPDTHDINQMNHMSTWEISGKPYEKLLGKKLKLCTREEIASVRHEVQKNIAENANGLAFVKTHHALVMDRQKPTINFDITCGAIYIVRNPLDVAISFSHHMNTTIDGAIEQMAIEGLETPVNEKSVYEVYSSWSHHVESWTRKQQRTMYIMRYEDMLSDPEQTFLGLARHLLLEPSDQQLQTTIDLSSFEKLQTQETEKGFKEKPKDSKRFFRSGKANQWQDELSDQQIEQIVKVHHKQMERFNYYPLTATKNNS